MPLASGSWCTRRGKMLVKKISARAAPTAIAKRFSSGAQAMGIWAPVTAMSSVATPGISQAGTACCRSCLPWNRRDRTRPPRITVSRLPTVHNPWPSSSL
ncbi:hypothetical protein D3C76_1244300 [compost metagenome]